MDILISKLLIEIGMGQSVGIKEMTHSTLNNSNLYNFDCRNTLYDTCVILLDDTQQRRLCFLNRGLLFAPDWVRKCSVGVVSEQTERTETPCHGPSQL